MTDSRKRRMSILDGLASPGSQQPAAAMSGNRALRSARDAVDSHRVWDLDPEAIEDSRPADRLDPEDVAGLRASIEANGQTVPILVRRHPADPERYLLVYGRRRLEAVRGSDRVGKVRALIASLDDGAALKAQVTENTARQDLSYIERALFACELLDSGFGNQSQVAEVLNATRSSVSMAVAVARRVGPELTRAIGPAHGIGRPRWEALVGELEASGADPAALAPVADAAQTAARSVVEGAEQADASAAAFEAVSRELRRRLPRVRAERTAGQTTGAPLKREGKPAGLVKRTKDGLRLEIKDTGDGFTRWLEEQAQTLFDELNTRWKERG